MPRRFGRRCRFLPRWPIAPPSAASAAFATSIAGRSCGVSASAAASGSRGIEITVTIDEKAFEGTGAFLLGAVLDRFFAEYSGFNNFTQTVIRSVERGEVMRWPPRMGTRRPL